ncbi:MAG: hypothetical protein JNM27_14375 [Leptospirales bacterium]|nr:hypothetical protein [Leptospirales bacterium]
MKILRAFLVASLLCGAASSGIHASEDSLQITNVRVTLEGGNKGSIKVTREILVKLDYTYSGKGTFQLWATLDEDDGTYDGSDSIGPGKGTLERRIRPSTPGTITEISIQASDEHQQTILEMEHPVNIEVLDDPQVAARREEGKGSSARILRFIPASPAKVKQGTEIKIEIEYDMKGSAPLQLWAQAEAGCCATYEGSEGISGKGRITRTITAGKGAVVTGVIIKIGNAAGATLFEEEVPVSFTVE